MIFQTTDTTIAGDCNCKPRVTSLCVALAATLHGAGAAAEEHHFATNFGQTQSSPVTAGKRMRWFAALLAAIAVSGVGCKTVTGTHTSLNQESLAKIKNLGVAVRVTGPFTVKVAQGRFSQTSGTVGAMVGAVVGAGTVFAVESARQAATDEKDAAKLRPLLIRFDCQRLSQEKLLEAFKRTGVFECVQPMSDSGPTSANADARLVVTILDWSLRPCLGEVPDEKKLEIFLEAHCQIIFKNEKVVWDRNLDLRDGKGRGFAEYQDTPGLLAKELAEALERLSKRMASEIQFPN